MKLKPIKNWTYTKELEPLLFLAQRLDELLFDYTLDTYKSPALNAPYLCIEALSLIDDIESGNIDAANLEHVLEELQWSLRSDSVAKTLIKGDVGTFFVGHGTKSELHRQRILLDVLQRSIPPDMYLLALQEELLGAVEGGGKADIDRLARGWVTTLTNYGVSKAHLHRLLISYFFEDQPITSTDQLRTFFAEALPYVHSFEVYFAVDKEISRHKKTLEEFDVEVLEQLPDDLTELANQASFEIDEGEVLVCVSDVDSYDIYSGRREAEERLERVRNSILLFSHKRPLTWQGNALVRQCCLEKPVATRSPKSSVQKISDLRPALAAPRLEYLVENLSLSSADQERFDRIVDLHGLCAIQDAPETQLLSLWICIESLVPTEPTRNKIANIIESAVPVLMLLYVRRLIKNLLRDLLEWDKAFTKRTLADVKYETDEWLAYKVLLLLTPEYEDTRKKFYERLSDFPLMRYRIFRMSESLSNPTHLRKLLEEHRKKLDWQSGGSIALGT